MNYRPIVQDAHGFTRAGRSDCCNAKIAVLTEKAGGSRTDAIRDSKHKNANFRFVPDLEPGESGFCDACGQVVTRPDEGMPCSSTAPAT